MKQVFVVGSICLLIGVLGGFFVSREFAPKTVSSPKEIASLYPFLSPRIFAINQNDILINFVDLRKQLIDYIGSIKDSLGLYFEYLPSGNSIGVNSSNEYIFVSLLKLPVVMAVYKQVEQGHVSIDDTLTIQQDDLDNQFGTLYKSGAGTKITVKDAILKTIADSDNTAKNALGHVITNDDILDVLDSLDIPQDADKNTPVVSPKNYSSILRSLYLSSYLTRKYSNLLLNDMTLSHFNDEIAQPIPNTIKVAHKIGVHEPSSDTPVYSDCGIVYLPKRPYILCIMTKSPSDKAKEYMQTISKMIYDYVRMANN